MNLVDSICVKKLFRTRPTTSWVMPVEREISPTTSGKPRWLMDDILPMLGCIQKKIGALA